MAVRRLVVNADDFGFTPDVNAGIIEAHRHGILTATTLMANGLAFNDAVRLARETPSLDIGCHLVLIGGKSLVTGRNYPLSVPRLMGALIRREIDPFVELKAQVEKVFDAGLPPTHLDTHKHTHLAPQVLAAVAHLSEEFGVRWVRRPFDLPIDRRRGAVPAAKRATSVALRLVRRRFHRVLQRHGCRATDHFAGFQITGRFEARQLAELIAALPEGSTEFMCHPGFCRETLRAARTRLKESRERELEALVAPEVKEALIRADVELVTYRDLDKRRIT